MWDGERLFQAAKFGTEMQYQHLVFEEFARKIQPNINVFVVPDGFDTTIDPSIVAEFAHVVYRFGHSMLTESIDRFDPDVRRRPYRPDRGLPQSGTVRGANHAIDRRNRRRSHHSRHDPSGRQRNRRVRDHRTAQQPAGLAARPRDHQSGARPGHRRALPECRPSQFYEATNQDILLKPYESWVDFAGHLKHEASIINFIAAYGTHEMIVNATTIEEKRDAAMALVGLPPTIAEVADISNASFELDSLVDGAPNVNSHRLETGRSDRLRAGRCSGSAVSSRRLPAL